MNDSSDGVRAPLKRAYILSDPVWSDQRVSVGGEDSADAVGPRAQPMPRRIHQEASSSADVRNFGYKRSLEDMECNLRIGFLPGSRDKY